MTTALFYHSAFLNHDTGNGHPERADRLRAIMQRLEAEEFAQLDRRSAMEASLEQIGWVHTQDYIQSVLAAIPQSGHRYLDGDTVISPASGQAALRAAGAVCAAVDAVMAGEVRNAFCAVRPPGHHAEPDRAMGFCLFNNVAIGAAQARVVYNVKRIAVIDFDVHHGNGTEAAFRNDPNLFYASSHQWPLYPGTGDPDEHGLGNICNIILNPGDGSAEFRAKMMGEVLPQLDQFAPEFILISAGFDAHRLDPLANLNLTDADYSWVTEQITALARRHAQDRIVSVLEGGYNLEALASATAAHVAALMLA